MYALTVCYKPARLLVATTAKVGSTTLFARLLSVAGFPEAESDPRKFLRQSDTADKLKKAGLEIGHSSVENLVKLRTEHPDYMFVAIQRDPVKRLLSGYRNKTNRYCKRYMRMVYAYSKLRQFVKGPPDWGNINVGNSYMRKFLSLEQFVAGLERHGTNWDSHFATQESCIGTRQVAYDRFLRLEHLMISLWHC